MAEIPQEFLRSLKSIQDFTKTLSLLKNGVASDAETPLSPDQCAALLWAVQLLREKRNTDKGETLEDEHYHSTACYHDMHSECRLMCKHCGAPCRCMCHV